MTFTACSVFPARSLPSELRQPRRAPRSFPSIIRAEYSRPTGSADGAATPASFARRAALLAPSFLLLGGNNFAQAKEVTLDGIFGERFQQCEATFTVPDSWKTRPGQKVKQDKYILYTDTYGPVFRYTKTFPRLLDGEGAQALDQIQLQTSPRPGIADITELGDIDAIDAQTAFAIEAKNGEIQLAEIASATQRKDKQGVVYYEWQLNLPTEGVMLLSSAVTGGGLYVFSLDSTSDQWARNKDDIKAVWASFSVAPAEESSTDLSNRIYNSAPSLMK